MERIKYREGYKYQLVEDYTLLTDIAPANPRGMPEGVGNDYVWLGRSGLLIVRRGYAWDGPSGPTVDTLDSLRGSLVHDALYQLMREEFLSRDYRERADQLLLECLIADGMLPIRAAAWFAAVRLAAGSAADPANAAPILIAP